MKKRMMIFGNSYFFDIETTLDSYKIINKNVYQKIKKNYIIDNFSTKRIDYRSMMNNIEVFTKAYMYEACVITFEEGNLLTKEELVNIAYELTKNKIKGIFIPFTDDKRILSYISEVANVYGCSIIYQEEFKHEKSRGLSNTKIGQCITRLCN